MCGPALNLLHIFQCISSMSNVINICSVDLDMKHVDRCICSTSCIICTNNIINIRITMQLFSCHLHLTMNTLLTQIEVIFHRVIKYFKQFHNVGVVQLLEDCDLSVYPIEGIHWRFVPVRRSSTCNRMMVTS